MNVTKRRWLGGALIAIAIVIAFASTKVVDVPGPMQASKPEFTFEFNTLFMSLSVVLAVAGMLILKLSFRDKT
jgi:hypothetical protein